MLNLASKARPYFGAIVLTAGLLVGAGIYSATRMPSGIYPEVDFPRIAVVAKSPGLDVVTSEIKITRPLEQELSTVQGAAQVRSKTIRGAAEIYIDFTPDTNMLVAEQRTWNKIGTARANLPADTDMTVERMTPSINPILSVVLTGGDNPSQLRDYAYYELAPRVKTVPNVLYANVAGGDIREIEVEARPEDLLAAGLSAADLADQLTKAHILQPAGRVERAPFAWMILVNSQAQTVRQLEQVPVETKTHQVLKLRDVADVRVWHQDRVLSVGYQGKEAVVISVFRTLGGNTVTISDAVRELLRNQPLPSNIKATVVYDQARFVSTSVHNVRDAIIIGGFFSVLILLLFLHSWRATFISAISIPATLAITFLFMHWMGETFNLMSLGGLAVAIGLIIDDTVVVIENIARHLSPGGTAGEPGRDGKARDPIDLASGEITGAVVGSSLTTVIVFLPLAFIVGVYGQFFASLTKALSIAVLVSMVISLTLIPVFAARFMRGRPMPGPGRFYTLLADWYEKALGLALRWHWVTLAVSLAAVFVGVVLYTGISNPWAKQEAGKPPPPQLVPRLETGLMPDTDEGAFVLDYWAPTGTPLAEVEKITRVVEQVLSENPDVEAYMRRTGSENGIFATQPNRGDFTVILRPAPENPVAVLTTPLRPKFDIKLEKELDKLSTENEKKYGAKPTDEQKALAHKEAVKAFRAKYRKYRRRSVQDVMDEVEDKVKDNFSEHQFKFETIKIMQDELDDLSGASRPIEVQIFGPDYKMLRRLASAIGDKMETEGKGRGFKDVDSSVRGANPDLVIVPDKAKAGQVHLSPGEIQRQVGAMYLGVVATQVRESALRITDVRVRYPDRLRYGGARYFDPERLLNQLLLVPEKAAGDTAGATPSIVPLAGAGRVVPLSAVARVEHAQSPDEQWRQNQQPAIFVKAEINSKEGGLGSMVADIRRWVPEVWSKNDVPATYRWQIGGHYLKQQDAFHSLLLVMIVAVILVYIMLAFQFRSVLLPLTIFLTEPLSLVSGLFALWLTKTPLNVSSYMGMVLLIGLDMKNGILIVEYVQQLRAEGMELMPALLHAGRVRFRPILMTSLAAILGLLPLALGIGPGAQMQQPLAIVVIGGLTANMLFTRMVIPVGYLVLERPPKQAPPAKVEPVAPPAPAPAPAVSAS